MSGDLYMAAALELLPAWLNALILWAGYYAYLLSQYSAFIFSINNEKSYLLSYNKLPTPALTQSLFLWSNFLSDRSHWKTNRCFQRRTSYEVFFHVLKKENIGFSDLFINYMWKKYISQKHARTYANISLCTNSFQQFLRGRLLRG